MRLKDRHVLVTGVSRGIGRAICFALANEGAHIAVHYKTGKEAADETLEKLPIGRHFKVQADVSKADECERLMNDVINKFGSLDLLVNNAGIYETMRVTDVSYEQWQTSWKKMLDVNLISAANLSYLFIKHAVNKGKIINIASRAGFKGEKEAAHYGASKAAMINLTRSMANELAASGIRFYCIAPGWVETEMTEEHLKLNYDKVTADIPLGAPATAEDVAGAALYLASDDANYLNGFCIDVNGGSYFH